MEFLDRIIRLFARPETREAFEHRLRTGNVTFPQKDGEMDRQAIYEWVRAFFSLPDVGLSRSTWGDGSIKSCFYRFDPDMDPERAPGVHWSTGNYAHAPLRCGIGCGIPDSMYTKDMECGAFHSLVVRFPHVGTHFGLNDAEMTNRSGSDNMRFLAAVQSAHDCAEDVQNVVERLDELAAGWGLRVVS